MTEAAGVAAHKAGRREWIGLAVIALPCGTALLDTARKAFTSELQITL